MPTNQPMSILLYLTWFVACLASIAIAAPTLFSSAVDLQSYTSFNNFAFDSKNSALYTVAFDGASSDCFVRVDAVTGAVANLGTFSSVSSVMASCRAIDDINKRYAFLSSSSGTDTLIVARYDSSPISAAIVTSTAMSAYSSFTGITFNNLNGLIYTFAFDGLSERLLAINADTGAVQDQGALPCSVVIACSATIDPIRSLYAFFGGYSVPVSAIIVANFTYQPVQAWNISLPTELSMFRAISFNTEDGLLYTYAYNETLGAEVLISIHPVLRTVSVVGQITWPADPIVSSGTVDHVRNVYVYATYDANAVQPVSMVLAAYGSRCDRGAYGGVGETSCTRCNAGTYSAATNRTSASTCRRCDVGSYALVGASACVTCPAGSYCASVATQAPQPCPSGSYSHTVGATTSTSCLTCDVGHYCPNTTMSVPCPIATYNPSVGMTTLTNCLPCARSNIVGASTCSGGSITSVVPNVLPAQGLTRVTIHGVLLGNGDITSVTINGITAAILSQTSDIVVVLAGTSTTAGVGNVVVSSIGLGDTGLTDAFTYLAALEFVSTSNTVQEAGPPVTITLSLTVRPSSEVEVPVTMTCYGGVLSNNTVIITPTLWKTGSTVALSVSNDQVALGADTCTLAFGPSSSLDAQFAGLTSTLVLSRVDDDVVNAIAVFQHNVARYVSTLSGWVLTEGQTEIMGVRLSCSPVVPVMVNLTQSAPGLLSLVPDVLVFDSTNWNRIQNVSTVVFNDNSIQSAVWDTVSITATANRLLVAAPVPFTMPVLILDDDDVSSVVQSSPPVRNYVIETGQASTIAVFMAQAFATPSTQATLTFQSNNTQAAVVSPATVTLTNADVFQFMAITVMPVNDWMDNADVPFEILISVTVGASVSTVRYQMINRNGNHAAMNVSATQLTVNETGAPASFGSMFATRPAADVVLVPVYNSSLMRVTPSSILVTASSWRSVFGFTVSGLRNSIVGDVNTNLTIRCQTTDQKYTGLEKKVYVNIVDIFWPTVLRLVPEVHPVVGIAGNLSVLDMLPGASFTFRSTSAVNRTMISASGALWAPADFGGLRPDKSISSEHTFSSPMMNYTGYCDVTIINPDGGWAVLVDGAFYTRDCPYVGFIGYGEECRRCPLGADCPGGNRIWPLPGWWSPGEFSGTVIQCNPPAALRCVGGRSSSCGRGYQGSRCGQCSQGFYLAGDACAECESTAQIIALLLAQYLLLFVFVLALLFMSENGLEMTQFLLLGIRAIWITQPSSVVLLPPLVQAVGNVIALFVGDLNASHPGCSGVDNFASLYYVNLAVTLGIALPICLVYFVRYRLRVRRAIKEQQQSDGSVVDLADLQDSKQQLWKHFLRECVVGLNALSVFVYEVIVTMSMNAFFCLTSFNEQQQHMLVLSQDSSIVCFAGTHIGVFILSCLMLVLLLVIQPIITVRAARTYLAGMNIAGAAGQSDLMQQLGKSATGEFTLSFYYWGIMSPILIDLVLMASNVYLRVIEPLSFAGVSLTALFLYFIVFVLARPFRSQLKNIVFAFVISAAFLQVAVSLLLHLEKEAAAGILSYIVMVQVILYILGAIIFALHQVCVLSPRYRRLSLAAAEKLTRRTAVTLSRSETELLSVLAGEKTVSASSMSPLLTRSSGSTSSSEPKSSELSSLLERANQLTSRDSSDFPSAFVPRRGSRIGPSKDEAATAQLPGPVYPDELASRKGRLVPIVRMSNFVASETPVGSTDAAAELLAAAAASTTAAGVAIDTSTASLSTLPLHKPIVLPSLGPAALKPLPDVGVPPMPTSLTDGSSEPTTQLEPLSVESRSRRTLPLIIELKSMVASERRRRRAKRKSLKAASRSKTSLLSEPHVSDLSRSADGIVNDDPPVLLEDEFHGSTAAAALKDLVEERTVVQEIGGATELEAQDSRSDDLL
eukprot:TRINITY_DN3876_c1_g2_i1.p1 TRINITY_DN3876_c1_g2~~TRINITY_DN3876_c1_g2_i1.p1  ORF type:complete len:1915 (+),score=364.46 TRINITY_DN3876_c1_g2_i1:42-5747(+)